MFILLTSEESNTAERGQLIYFFGNGLHLLHVRKPGMEEKEFKSWLSQFEEEHLKKMVLHQHHSLAEAFPVKGIHLKENFRRNCEDLSGYLSRFRGKGLSISSSFHSLDEVKLNTSLFDYVFLSPVFSSISKESYRGKAFDVKALSQKIVALGGIDEETIPEAKKLGYAGVVVLGAVWLAEDKQKRFSEIYDEYRRIFQ